MENKKEKQFVVVSDYDLGIFESRVNEYIEKGYYSLGNIVIARMGDLFWLCKNMEFVLVKDLKWTNI